MRLHWSIVFTSVLFIMLLQSCKKGWLDAKPDKSLNTPDSIDDFQQMLDNPVIFNVNQASGLGEIAAGDFYVLFSSWQNLFTAQEKSAYTWAATDYFYNGELSLDWSHAYARILHTNAVLNGIDRVKPGSHESNDWNNVKGSALFLRAFDYFHLAQEYCKPYIPTSADAELGLPLRLVYDVNAVVKRASLQETYDRVIADLKLSAKLLKPTPSHKTRPSKQASFALLARVYLAMELYSEAGLYADSALQIQHQLLDYAQIKNSGTYPMPRLNTEVLFHSNFTYGIFNVSRLIVEPDLYNEYHADDYRKTLFFMNVSGSGVTYRGSYNGDKNLFGGLAVDEVYLIRAECNARANNLPGALSDLNILLRKRLMGNYEDLRSNDQETVLRWVLKERRKELAFRGLRWLDLRRLNRDSRFAVTLTRTLNNITYTLLPNDKKYVFPLDKEEIRLSGFPQNDR